MKGILFTDFVDLVERELPAVLRDNRRARNRQALPRSLADRFRGEKRLEQPVADFFGNARARVGNPDFHPRVIVPGLVPMYCEERNAPLGLLRLRTDASALDPHGRPASTTAAEDSGSGHWPPWPHPFP